MPSDVEQPGAPPPEHLERRTALLDRPAVRIALAVLGVVVVLVALGLLFSPRYWRF